MTPSEKLDLILFDGRVPKIADVVDLDKYKYVWRNHGGIRCGNWLIPIPYGFMSDGASGVPDRLPEGYFAHDRMYASPFAYYKGVHKQLSKRKCDLLYARIGLNKLNIVVALRGLLLSTGINRVVWNNYRKQNHLELLESKIVPKALQWNFPSQFLDDAVWVG